MKSKVARTIEGEQIEEHEHRQASGKEQAQEQPQAPEIEQEDNKRIYDSIKSLRDVEKDAKEQMEQWDACYVTQPATKKSSGRSAGTKRKASSIENESEEYDTDSDSNSDAEDGVAPYDPNNQSRPKLPIYHPGFVLTQTISQQVLKVFSDYITKALNGGYQDSAAQRLREEVLNSAKIKYHDSVIIAVAGDTGAGKSALLNAILGVVNLNIESDAGSACTCVITEFCQSPQTQQSAYGAEVQFFDMTVCVQKVTNLFRNWLTVKEKQVTSPDDVGDEDLHGMATARDCMQQMFADRLDQGDIESFIGTATLASHDKVLGQLVEWTKDMRQKFLQDSDTSIYFMSDSPEKLIEQYHPFTREVPHASYKGQPLLFSPWPLVKMVRISLDSPILKQNVILADVPGVSDTNRFRVDNALRYLQGCDKTIVVGKIDRLQDNSTFQSQYMEAFRRKRSGSVILVATRSDDLNEENNSTSALPPATHEKLAFVDKKVADLLEQIKRIDNNKQTATSNSDKRRMKDEKKILIARKTRELKKRKNILVDNRNHQVRSVVGSNYRTNTGDDAGAAVFCVSNRMYMRHLRGYDTSDEPSIPTMKLDQTQIPALCSYIYSLPSKGRAASLNHFVRTSTPTLLSIIQMSCSTTTQTRANYLVEIVHRSRTALEDRMKELTRRFCDSEVKCLENHLENPSLQKKFDSHARKSLESWERIKPASHLAAVKKQGIHVQKKLGINLNWNEDLMAPVRPLIDDEFRRIIDKSLDNFVADASQAVREELNKLDYTLKNDTKALASNAYNACFKEGLSGFFESVRLHVNKASKSLKDELIKINSKAISVKGDDYFPEAMRDIYTAASTLRVTKGMSLFETRKKYLKDTIIGPTGPFTSIAGWVCEDAEKAVEKASGQLSKDMDNMLRQVQAAFERMKHNKENDTPQGIAFRKDLDFLVAEARKVMDGVARESLDLCLQYK